jgi:hypothetical protein
MGYTASITVHIARIQEKKGNTIRVAYVLQLVKCLCCTALNTKCYYISQNDTPNYSFIPTACTTNFNGTKMKTAGNAPSPFELFQHIVTHMTQSISTH